MRLCLHQRSPSPTNTAELSPSLAQGPSRLGAIPVPSWNGPLSFSSPSFRCLLRAAARPVWARLGLKCMSIGTGEMAHCSYGGPKFFSQHPCWAVYTPSRSSSRGIQCSLLASVGTCTPATGRNKNKNLKWTHSRLTRPTLHLAQWTDIPVLGTVRLLIDSSQRLPGSWVYGSISPRSVSTCLQLGGIKSTE